MNGTYTISLEQASMQLKAAVQRFLPLPDADWGMLLPHLEVLNLQRNEHFAREGKRENKVALLLSGDMRHYYNKDGKERTTYFYFEGHFVSAYISCITQQLSELSIQALTDCTLVVFPYSAVRDLYERSHAWERFGRLIAEYLAIGLEQRMTSLLMMSPEERYLDLIKSNKQKITDRIPQQYIASYLGITPVSLSRIRNRVSNLKI